MNLLPGLSGWVGGATAGAVALRFVVDYLDAIDAAVAGEAVDTSALATPAVFLISGVGGSLVGLGGFVTVRTLQGGWGQPLPRLRLLGALAMVAAGAAAMWSAPSILNLS